MADHFETSLLGRRTLCDLLEPGIVRRTEIAVADEEGRARLEQELHRKPITCQTVVDHLAEGVHRRAGTMELGVGKINAVQNTELLAARCLSGALIRIERIAVAPRIVGFDAVI